MCSGICRYIWYSYWAKVFRFHIESWPEWDSNPRPRAYRAHALTTELSACLQWNVIFFTFLLTNKVLMNPKDRQRQLKSSLMNPKGRQRQLKSFFIKTLFESKDVKDIRFHCLKQLVYSETLYFLRFYFQIKF